jgi:glucosamine--fructose-6-phosphate aminotransferase (isomerizing)
MAADQPEVLVGVRKECPLVVGVADGESFIASAIPAFLSETRTVQYLNDDELVVLRPGSTEFMTASGTPLERDTAEIDWDDCAAEKGGFETFMLKEIYEQPAVIGDTLHALLNPMTRTVQLPELAIPYEKLPKITIVACGTSYYAGLVSKYWFEKLARLPVEIDVASEFRYRDVDMPPGGLAVFISQSGETADTLAALRYAKAQKQITVALVNVPESTMAREADLVLSTYAGPEIGVASTKAFTTQLTVLACFALAVGRARGTTSAAREAELSSAR